MSAILTFFISFLTFASPETGVLDTIKQYQKQNKSCLIVYGVQENEKSKIFNQLKESNYDYFSEEGNLLITWGPKEKQQLKALSANKIIIDKVLDSGFDPNNVHPTIVEQLKLLKELTTKCK